MRRLEPVLTHNNFKHAEFSIKYDWKVIPGTLSRVIKLSFFVSAQNELRFTTEKKTTTTTSLLALTPFEQHLNNEKSFLNNHKSLTSAGPNKQLLHPFLLLEITSNIEKEQLVALSS